MLYLPLLLGVIKFAHSACYWHIYVELLHLFNNFCIRFKLFFVNKIWLAL